MAFEAFNKQAWRDHGDDPQVVGDRLESGLGLITSSEDILKFCRLTSHVCGEHLANWKLGIDLLEKAKALSVNNDESMKTAHRNILSFKVASNAEKIKFESISDEVFALANAASMLCACKQYELCQSYLRNAAIMAEKLDPKDSAHKSIAIAGNNIAVHLEELVARRQADKELMIFASRIGRKHWELAGTWVEIERAEYRLSQSYLQAKDFAKSLQHAENCLSICQKNSAEPIEFFFAYQAKALALKSKGDLQNTSAAIESAKNYFEKLSPDDKTWSEPSLKKLIF